MEEITPEVGVFVNWYYDLHLLTYGELDDREVLIAFKTILQWKKDEVFISEDTPGNLYTTTEYWLYLSILHDCIEYGTSPRGAWLTKLGDQILSILNTDMDTILKELE